MSSRGGSVGRIAAFHNGAEDPPPQGAVPRPGKIKKADWGSSDGRTPSLDAVRKRHAGRPLQSSEKSKKGSQQAVTIIVSIHPPSTACRQCHRPRCRRHRHRPRRPRRPRRAPPPKPPPMQHLPSLPLPPATAKGLPHESARAAAACGSGSDRTVPLTRWPGERFVYYFVYFQLTAPQFPSSLPFFTVRRRSVAINSSGQT